MQKTENWWSPASFQERQGNLITRGKTIDAIRSFLRGRGYTEVDTPALQVSPGLEPHLMAFRTRLESPDGRSSRELFLHTSPEFAMKKLLSAGAGSIFQFARVFRNREGSTTHHPEFTMLEWYGVGLSYDGLMAETEELVRSAAEFVGCQILQWQGKESKVDQSWERLTVAEALKRYTDIDIYRSLKANASPDAAILRLQAAAVGVRCGAEDSWDDIFFRIWLERVEPNLGVGVPTIICDYPIHMAALSRPKPDNPSLAERFEVYICGMELANAFGELQDPREQERRFQADMDLKERLYGERYPVDQDLLQALEQGLPDCSGIALGIDRLVMLLAGAKDIRDVLWAPV